MVPNDAVRDIPFKGLKGDLPANEALSRILNGTGFSASRDSSGIVAIVRRQSTREETLIAPVQIAQAVPVSRGVVETVTVTSSKLGGAAIQNIPISITALSQEQLTATQTAGGPDLIKQVPNMTFTKTNFSGYSIQLRGIGTQAISVTTDPAVAVAFNDTPFIRNHFFEQEFYDVSQVEVLRGPQGTLYGRNATAGVVNLISAKPSDQFEAMASADIGNYQNRRLEAMINIPIIDDRFDLRIAGSGPSATVIPLTRPMARPSTAATFGRDVYLSRGSQSKTCRPHWYGNISRKTTVGLEVASNSARPSIHQRPSLTSNGVSVPVPLPTIVSTGGGALDLDNEYLSQSCQLTSLYSKTAFQVPYGASLPYVVAAQTGQPNILFPGFDPYSETTQSTNLRSIQSEILPQYKSKNDTIELNSNYTINPALTLTSQTGFNQDFLWSTEDYNRFDTAPGIFSGPRGALQSQPNPYGYFKPDPEVSGAYIFCDPQLGCSDRLVAQDLSEERAWQLSQEVRLTSNFSGPVNFSIGGNYLHYETEENYYVFANTLSVYSAAGYSTNSYPGNNPLGTCLQSYSRFQGGYQSPNPLVGGGEPTFQCSYVDPNPISSLNNLGHNYFLSQNPYVLNSYALFGEAYYNITDDLKLTGGIRWTVDKKHFVDIPSEVITDGIGYFNQGTVNQEWDRPTGRVVLNWTPRLDFTDQSAILYIVLARLQGRRRKSSWRDI